MKFCKNLQKVVDISDPEWAPYWTNYKMLKKLIKELPSLVPTDDVSKQTNAINSESRQQSVRSEPNERCRPGSPSSEASSTTSASAQQQQHGDKTAEVSAVVTQNAGTGKDSSNVGFAGTTGNAPSIESEMTSNVDEQKQSIGKSPGEVAFFKLLHSEFKKAVHFFERAQEEFSIREGRIREGMEIMKKPNSIMVSEKWSLLAKSLHRLYKDLLLLETFAIMTYCSFSKILKKHDKVTGYETRNAFMTNVVNRANFTNYPDVLSMISRCEALYEEVSQHLISEGKEGLCEDERLFINMIHRLNSQVMDTREAEGAPDLKDGKNKRPSTLSNSMGATSYPAAKSSCRATSSLRLLVEENDAMGAAAQVSAAMSDDGDDNAEASAVKGNAHHDENKRPACSHESNVESGVNGDPCPNSPKRARTE
uniref:SPX domain-containing protein n=1 Tax=Trieres chinensis TaxID=1514140 RepID=A0A7S2A9F4_TRICV